jgi:uncharacterized iron-regulated membrane protein
MQDTHENGPVWIGPMIFMLTLVAIVSFFIWFL